MQRYGIQMREEMIPMDQNILRDPDDAMKESLERIYQLLEEKKYFMVKDELLKFNDADIAEMFEELLEDPDDHLNTLSVSVRWLSGFSRLPMNGAAVWASFITRPISCFGTSKRSSALMPGSSV